MENLSSELLIRILRDCSSQTPEPLYPSQYAEATGLDRAALDLGLDRLRLGGFLRLSDWVGGKGQGYLLTPHGQQALAHPQLLTLLQMADDFNRSSQRGDEARTARPGFERIDDPLQNDLAADPSTTWSRGEAVRAALFEPPPPVVTMTLVAVNVLAFLIGGVLAQQRDIPLKDYFAFNSANAALGALHMDLGGLHYVLALFQHEWWRLFTYSFVHAGLLHLFMNMYFLFTVGPSLEGMWGRGGFLFLYVVSGFIGGVAVVLSRSAAVGASGCLCGLLTSMVFWVWLNRQYLGRDRAASWLRNIFFNIFLIMVISMLPMVSAAGHFGGGLAGLAIALPMTFFRFGKSRQRTLGLVGMLVVPSIAIAVYGSLDHQVRMFMEATERAEEVLPNAFKDAEFLLRQRTLPADVEKTRQEFVQVQERTHEAAGHARKVEALAGLEKIKNLGTYMEDSAKLFGQFAQVLEHPENWDSERPALEQQFRRLVRTNALPKMP